MKVYLAAKFSSRRRLRPIRTALELLGHPVTSSWLNQDNENDYLSKRKREQIIAVQDLADVREADLLILDTLAKTRRGGREVEFGYALAKDKMIWLVGLRRNVFHELAYNQFSSWEKCLRYLKENYPVKG